MTRKTGNIGYGTTRTPATETPRESDPDSPQQGRRYREISFTVDKLENLIEDKVKEIMVRIEYMGRVLNESHQIPVVRDGTDVKLTTTISSANVSALFLDEILSNPVLLTVLDCTRPSSVAAPPQTPGIDAKKKASKVSTTPMQAKSTSFNVIGTCNLDIGSLALGEKEIRRTLLVEPDAKDSPLEIKTWVKYPKMSVYATSGDTPLVPSNVSKFNNAIGITVESIYNVPEYILSGTLFEAVLPLPAAGDRSSKIRYPNGLTVAKDMFPYRKKWLSISDREEAGARSYHRVPQHFYDIYSTLPARFDVKAQVKSSRRVIRWNMWRNCHMIKDDVNYFYTKLMRHRLWPVEIFLSPKSKEYVLRDKGPAKGDKKSKPAPSMSFVHPDHFMALLDLTPFLYPGVTKVRVAAPLYTYSQTDLVNKFGAEFISDYGNPSFSQPSLPGNRRKSSSVKSKSSVRETEAESSAVLVYNEGAPTFIIVEVELVKPFTPKRSLESYEIDLRQHLCLKEKMSQKTTTFDLMKRNFSQCVMNAMGILCNEYSNYCLNLNKTQKDCTDLFQEFQKHLGLQESFHRIKASIERSVIELIKERFGAVTKYEDELPEIYVYLVKEMHRVTNQCLIGHRDYSNRAFFNDHLQLYAEEAIEDGDYRLAKDYLILKLSRNTASPDYWLDFAVFCIKLRNYEDAIEAVREALGLDFYHQIGLLMYALLMTKLSNSLIAEAACGVLLIKYPNFIEGWMALFLIYSVFSNFEGAHVALQEATKAQFKTHTEEATPVQTDPEEDDFMYKVYDNILKEEPGVKYGLSSFKNGVSCSEPLSWTITLTPPDNIFIRTVVLMQKLGFYEYAALCLAEELLTGSKNGKPSPAYVYYTCVNYYLQERYEEAIPILQTTVEEYGKDCFLWSLMGHCFYKLDNHAEAIGCYEYVRESYNRPNDIHLVNSRMGFYYLAVNKYTCARQSLINACKYSPSPKLWKGIGIACLEMREGEEAEIAFSEANYLDNKDPETWAYLAITNAYLRRLDLFRQCYVEAKKRHLKNSELIRKIKSCLNLNGLKEED